MKPFFLSLTMLAIFSLSTVQAQNSFYIGAKGGANTSKYKFTEDLRELYPNTNSIFGMNGGFDMGILINGWSISTGVHYVQKGSKYQTDNFNDSDEVGYFSATEKLHFISIPVLLGFREQLANRVGWSLAVGPSFNFGLSGKLDETTEYFGTDDVDYQNYKIAFGEGVNEDYKPVQVGFQISPGLYVDVNSRSKVIFNVTWDFGTSDAFNPRYKDANGFFDSFKGDQINRTTMFTVGYEYHFNFQDRY